MSVSHLFNFEKLAGYRTLSLRPKTPKFMMVLTEYLEYAKQKKKGEKN